MPYKDLLRKRDWEQQHRHQRLARRRQLRHIEAARKRAQPVAPEAEQADAGFLLIPLVGGGALAASNPKLAMSIGSVTLLGAAVFELGRRWWIVGLVILVLGLFFHWINQSS